MLTFKRKGNIFLQWMAAFANECSKKCAKTKYTQEGKRQLVKIKSTLAGAKGAFLGNRLHLGHLRVWRYVTYIISKTIANKYLSLFIIAREDSIVKNNSTLLSQSVYRFCRKLLSIKHENVHEFSGFFFTCKWYKYRDIFPSKQTATMNNHKDIEYISKTT